MSEPESEWRPAHVGFSGDGFRVLGVAVWEHDWQPIDEPPVSLPHPSYPGQLHAFQIYRVETDRLVVRFAAAELSNGVWGFYTSAPWTRISIDQSLDGMIRIERRIGEWIGNRYDSVGSWLVLSNAETSSLVIDCGQWKASEAFAHGDGGLLLRLRQNQFDAAYLIDPGGAAFRDVLVPGATLPIGTLAAVAEKAYRATAGAQHPHYRHISPCGTLAVDLDSVEWSNTHWVHSPRVTETATGEVLLDLWNTDWDAAVSFPAAGTVMLALRRYRSGAYCSVEIDAAARRYRLREPEDGEGPVGDVADAIERAAASAPPERRPEVAPRPFAAWRTALILLAGSLAAIGGVAWYLAHQPPEPQKLTPLPTMPKPVSNPVRYSGG